MNVVLGATEPMFQWGRQTVTESIIYDTLDPIDSSCLEGSAGERSGATRPSTITEVQPGVFQPDLNNRALGERGGDGM